MRFSVAPFVVVLLALGAAAAAATSGDRVPLQKRTFGSLFSSAAKSGGGKIAPAGGKGASRLTRTGQIDFGPNVDSFGNLRNVDDFGNPLAEGLESGAESLTVGRNALKRTNQLETVARFGKNPIRKSKDIEPGEITKDRFNVFKPGPAAKKTSESKDFSGAVGDGFQFAGQFIGAALGGVV